jgi:rhodanese-related sulfurtransferase
MTLIPISPPDAARMLEQGGALLIDVREPDEYARIHVRGAVSRPLSGGHAADDMGSGVPVIFTCRSGMRTTAHCDRLAESVAGVAYRLEGGLDAWQKAGLPLATDARAPLEIMRQVQIGAGGLVLLGAALGYLVDPRWIGLAAFVGAGLLMAGVTGFCGMARLLKAAPWNQR